MHVMILVVGRTASGKDYFAQKLANECQLKRVISYTTRPRRLNEPSDSHIFVTPDEAKTLDRAVSTTIGGYEYFTTPKQLQSTDIYVIDPKGINELLANLIGGMYYIIVHVTAPEDIRKKRFVERLGNITDEEKTAALQSFEKRNEAEDQEFAKFEDLMKNINEDTFPDVVDMALELDNSTDNPANVDNHVATVKHRLTFIDNMNRLTDYAAKTGLIRTNPSVSKDDVAWYVMHNTEQMTNLFYYLTNLAHLDVRDA